jgi:hypothetical protein
VDVQDLHTEGTWCAILALASDVLWAASGRRWRNVTATETVTLDPDWCRCWGSGWVGYGSLRVWSPVTDRARRVRLPRPDVTAITSVTLDGAVFTAYRLAGNWLYRTDGLGWPLTTTTRITYQFGRPVPSTGTLAAITLTTELGKALAGKACALPARVTSVTRQGISFTALESVDVLKEGLTGVHSVDVWIRAVNPGRTTQSASVWSPDVTEARAL